jgi:hypothetical protein
VSGGITSGFGSNLGDGLGGRIVRWLLARCLFEEDRTGNVEEPFRLWGFMRIC